MTGRLAFDQQQLFSLFMSLAGTPGLVPEAGDDPKLTGKRLGLVNGSAWVTLWSYYFGRKHLPGVKLVNVGNEAVQLNFMEAFAKGLSCPPQENIECFARYARELVQLANVDAILITCSTMNCSLPMVREAVADTQIPVLQIDEPMMRRALEAGGKVLIVTTHGPTCKSTMNLLGQTADEMGIPRPDCRMTTLCKAFELLGQGDITGHNRCIAEAITREHRESNIKAVVLAQLSMSVFGFSYPDPVSEFGIPVFNSGDEGFSYAAGILRGLP